MNKSTLWVVCVVMLGVVLASLMVAGDVHSVNDNLDKVKTLVSSVLDSNNLGEKVSKENISAYVSFAFDDNHANHLDIVAPILAEYDMVATRYYISEIDDPNFDECKILKDKYGWEIGAHTRTHQDLTTLTKAQLVSEIKGCKEDFRQNDIIVKTFAPPYTRINDTVKAIISEHYDSCRGPWGINKLPYDPYDIKILCIDNEVGLSMMDALYYIDEAKETSGWIVFVAHRVDYTDGNYSTDKSFFKTLVRIISEDPTIKTVTVSEALEAI